MIKKRLSAVMELVISRQDRWNNNFDKILKKLLESFFFFFIRKEEHKERRMLSSSNLPLDEIYT